MFIYAIGTSGSKQKIGYSRNPNQRLKTLQTGNPEQLLIHYQFEIDESVADKFEAYVHRQHNHKRLKGEWFEMTIDEVKSAMIFHEIMADTITAQIR